MRCSGRWGRGSGTRRGGSARPGPPTACAGSGGAGAHKGGDGIVALKDIKTLQDLKGKKVAFETGSVSQFFFDAVLKQDGMSEKDVTVVNMTATDAGVAFAARQVDAAVTWEPALSQGANAAHGHLLLSSADKPGLITDVVAVTPESATSVALTKVLLPDAAQAPLDAYDSGEAEAKLLIGDAALRSAFEDPTPHYDLGRFGFGIVASPLVVAPPPTAPTGSP